ncbi:MAG: HPr family phosphocarrier protein [Spirochaetales bacterium]|nr:HPr family phosphocarrier protein [Spirochaetales bacterium]
MVEKTTVIKNRAGIHARPAALIVQTAGKFASKVSLQKGDDTINAKSIMGIITLGAGFGTEIRIIADGEDETDAVDAIERLFLTRFEEE